MTAHDSTQRQWTMAAYWHKNRLRADAFLDVAISTMQAVQVGHPAVGSWYEAEDGPVPQRSPLELTEGCLWPGRQPGIDVRVFARNGNIESVVLYSGMASDHGSEVVPALVKVMMPGPASDRWDGAAMSELLVRLIESTPADHAILDSGDTWVEPTRRRAVVGWGTDLHDTPGNIAELPEGVSSQPSRRAA